MLSEMRQSPLSVETLFEFIYNQMYLIISVVGQYNVVYIYILTLINRIGFAPFKYMFQSRQHGKNNKTTGKNTTFM